MYQSLYREFRPKQFKDAIGHDHIAVILKNQLKNNTAGHAYLFTGVRGTGKTTFAKILAKAFNCLNLEEGEPCLECSNCKGIESGEILDIIEMDAASNTGVDNIRTIIEEASYLPNIAKYRIYIIDEVHMLSTGAFNALLKTLEEPPPHVKFILATTEHHKIPATILSRCQRFEFKKVSSTEIGKYLGKLSKAIELNITEDALELIANLGDGSVRDAISILESVKSIEGQITDDIVREVVGMPSQIETLKLALNISKENSEEVVNQIYKLFEKGIETQTLLEELMHIFEVSLIKERDKIIRFSKEEKEILQEISSTSKQKQFNIIKKLSEINNNLRWSKRKNAFLIAGIIEVIESSKKIEEYIKEKEESKVSLDASKIVNILENKNVNEHEDNKTNNKIEKNKDKIKVKPSFKDILLEQEEQKKQEKEKQKETEKQETKIESKDNNKNLNLNLNINIEETNTEKLGEKMDLLPLQQSFLKTKDLNLFAVISKIEIYLNINSAVIKFKDQNDLKVKEILSDENNIQKIKENLSNILNKDIEVKVLN